MLAQLGREADPNKKLGAKSRFTHAPRATGSSPEQQSRVRLRWQRQGLGTDEAQIRNSISNQFGPIKMIRILNKETLSENEVILRLLMEGEKGGTGTVGKKVQRIDNEWKIGATL